jgi:outer membrane protein
LQSISIVACNKPVEAVKEVKPLTYTSRIDERIYRGKRSTKNTKKSEEKGKQLAEINRFKQEAANFQAQAQQMVTWAQQKGLNYKKESNN